MTSLVHTDIDWPTWAEILTVLSLRAGFNTTVVMIGVTILGIAAGVVGTFAVLRKRALMGDALSHATLPGMAAAFLVAVALGAEGRSMPVLLLGATVSGIIGVLTVQA
ncbi:MAG: metal ABC transporter permease, partial [Rhodospirillales bacterium]|nr:metal ABC transporter permease [Rhodospirillales bacterium]